MKAVDLVDEKSSHIVETDKPEVVEPNTVLIKVVYAALDTFLNDIAKKTFAGSLGHNLKAKPLVPGNHFVGTVEAIANESLTSDFKIGDAVFGHLQYEAKTKQGSCSEYLVVSTNDLSKVPGTVPPEVAAASATEGMTALQALRDQGRLQQGESVLIVGAAGGVGSMAVGMAKQLGSRKVTAICSSKDVETVKGLGADEVVDRTETSIEDLSAAGDVKYDLILDASGRYGFFNLKSMLDRNGRMVSVLPQVDSMLFGSWLYPLLFNGKHSKFVLCRSKRSDLELLATWLESKAVQVSIDSVHDVKNFDLAWERQDNPKKTGRVVVKIDGGWE